MSSRSFLVADPLAAFIAGASEPTDPVAVRLIERTAELGGVSGMQIGPDQALFMTALTRISGARLVVEVGTFTGMSALAIARGLAPGGRLVCCDVSEEWTTIARAAWAEAGVDDRIDLRIGPAVETLAGLADEPLDAAFIDADKPSYVAYHDALVPRLRPGGWLAVDNTLWSGAVAEPPSDTDDANTVAIRAYAAHAVADDRVDTVVLSIGDGVTLNIKR